MLTFIIIIIVCLALTIFFRLFWAKEYKTIGGFLKGLNVLLFLMTLVSFVLMFIFSVDAWPIWLAFGTTIANCAIMGIHGSEARANPFPSNKN